MAIRGQFPSIRPSLDLNFAKTKKLDPRITFTRASSGTYVGSDGLIKTAAANEARFDHSPLTLESLGLLVEEQRANLLLRSEEFDTWNVNSGTTVTSDATASPAGTTTADKIVETASNVVHYRGRSAVLAANTTCALSVYVKAGERNFVGLQLTPDGTNYIYCTFNVQTGVASTPVNAGNGSGATASIQSIGNGWYRCALTGIPSSTAANPLSAIYVGNANLNLVNTIYTGDGTSGIYVWGAQLEAGAFPTSYIPTTAAAVTRSADVASISGSNFSAWYRQDAQTWFGEYAPIYTASATVPANTVHLLQVYNTAVSTNNYAIRGATNSVNQEFLARNPTAGVQFLVSTGIGFGVAGTNRKVSFGIDSSTLNSSTNGTINSTANNAAALMATHDILSIGSGIGGAPPYQVNGTIRRLTYWPTRLSNAILQALTS